MFEPSSISVSDYLDLWLHEYAEKQLKSTTILGYRKRIKNHIKPVIGSYYLQDVDHITLQRLLDMKYDQGYSLNTIISIKGILNKAFSYAHTVLRYIQYNPAQYIQMPSKNRKPKNDARRVKVDIVSHEVFQEIIERFPKGHSCHIPLMLGYWCGMRLGEVFALTWDDIDFENKTIDINKQVQMDETVKQWQFSSPKYDSFRIISMDEEVFKLLLRTKQKQDSEKKIANQFNCYKELYVDKDRLLSYEKKTGSKKVNPIMRRPEGDFITPRVTQHLGRIVHYQLGYTNFRFHDLRHSHATMLIDNKVDPIVVKERMGHKRIQTTIDTYTHITNQIRIEPADALNKIKKCPQTSK